MLPIFAFQADAINTFNPISDTTWLLMHRAQLENCRIFHYLPQNLFFKSGKIMVLGNFIKITDYHSLKYETSADTILDLADSSTVFIRQNPPFDINYITYTYILEHLPPKVKIINSPKALRDFPEKFSPLHFPNLTPETIIASNINDKIISFIEERKTAVIKPLYAFGGLGVNKLEGSLKQKLKTLHSYIKRYNHFLLQEYLSAVEEGDTRIIIFSGQVLGGFKRIPHAGDFRANMGIGGTAAKKELNSSEIQIAREVAQMCKINGIEFAGIDLIGNKLIEINITSPTGLIPLNKIYNHDFALDIIRQIKLKT